LREREADYRSRGTPRAAIVGRYLARHEPPADPDPTGRDLQDYLLRLPWAPEDPDPIDQCELAFVLQTFGYRVVRSLRSLRIRLTAEEADDWLFLWSVVGHLLGVRDELLPRPAQGDRSGALEARAQHVFESIDTWNRERAGVTESGRRLTATLLVSMREALRRATSSIRDFHAGLRPRIRSDGCPCVSRSASTMPSRS
jgi:hypothetical protein